MLLDYLIYFVASYVATVAFAMLYNVPTRTILSSGFVGAFGWIIYYFFSFQIDLDLFFGAGVAAFLVANLSQWMARYYKMPVIVFAIPGIIPLVPGGSAYNMMRAFVEGNSEMALMFGTETFLISGAIALGLSVNSALFQVFSSRQLTRKGKRYLP